MIHCIGNSHINTFSNKSELDYKNITNDYFIGHWLGPVIAYNFFEHHMAKAMQEVIGIQKQNNYITLIVGEVDCRLHLPKQADIQRRPDDRVVKECIDRLMRCYDVFINSGYNVIVTGTHPTTVGPHNDDPDNPVWGNVQRRNQICVLWNNFLKQEADKRKILYIDIYKYLVDENNITKMEYFLDYCHLNSSKVFNFIIEELKKVKII